MIKAHIQYSPWTNLYHATLLGGEFDNCHGQGETPDGALISLRLTVRARRNQFVNANKKVNYDNN